jgi:hypothetical protein
MGNMNGIGFGLGVQCRWKKTEYGKQKAEKAD